MSAGRDRCQGTVCAAEMAHGLKIWGRLHLVAFAGSPSTHRPRPNQQLQQQQQSRSRVAAAGRPGLTWTLLTAQGDSW